MVVLSLSRVIGLGCDLVRCEMLINSGMYCVILFVCVWCVVVVGLILF